MKTFEVYSLYDMQYRGRTLMASIQADRFNVDGFSVTFFKDTFFSTKPISVVVAGGPIAVLDTEFSLPIANSTPPDPLAALLSNNTLNQAPPTPRKRYKKGSPASKGNLLDLS